MCKHNVFLLLLACYVLLEAAIAFLAKLALFFCNGEAVGLERTLLAYAPVDIPACFADLLKAPLVPRRSILAVAFAIQFLAMFYVPRNIIPGPHPGGGYPPPIGGGGGG